MKQPARAVLFALASALAFCSAANEGSKAPLLETYESNSIGWTMDSDDVDFLDVKLSLKFPIMPELVRKNFSHSQAYFAATARFAQYLGTRESSPVLGKRFNPKLIWRFVADWDRPPVSTGKACGKNTGTDGCDYVDLAFAHESNGQSIDEERAFNVQHEVGEAPRAGNREFARDYISRGWDYLELAARRHTTLLGGVRLDGSFKVFLDDGPLQGQAENFHSWEDDPEVKKRKEVHGLAALLTWEWDSLGWWQRQLRFVVGYETGYGHPFRYNTFRLEFGTTIVQVPVLLFWQNGYANDLALYYQRASSVGFAAELARF